MLIMRTRICGNNLIFRFTADHIVGMKIKINIRNWCERSDVFRFLSEPIPMR